MASKTITLYDIGQKEGKGDMSSYIDMSDFDNAEDYREIAKHLKPLHIGGVDVTVMDLFNIPFKTDDKIKHFIQQRLKIDIDTPSGIQKINTLFEQARQVYEERYLKTLPTKFERLKFQNAQSVINFLRETKTNKNTGSIICAMAKISYAIDDVLSNEKIRRAGFLDRQFISQHLERPFQIQAGYEDKNGNIYRTGTVVIDGKIINFKLIARQKSVDSIIGKQLAEAKYYSVDEFKDLVGVTIYIEEDWQAALMMQYIDQALYEGKAQIRNKNGLDLQAVKEKVFLNEEFYLKLEKETKVSQEVESEEEKEHNERNKLANKKSSTAKDYREIKLVGNIGLSLEEGLKASKYPIGTEIKFVIGNHDNEKGVSLQSIYDYAKRFRELTRLGIPIRELDLVNYVNDFFENIDEILKKKNKEKTSYYGELFIDFIEGGLISEAMEIKGDLKMIQETLDRKNKNTYSQLLNVIQDELGYKNLNDNIVIIANQLKDKNPKLYISYCEMIHELINLGVINIGGQTIETILAIGLYTHFKKMLIKIKLPHSKKTYYFDENMLKMRDAGLYKKFETI